MRFRLSRSIMGPNCPVTAKGHVRRPKTTSGPALQFKYGAPLLSSALRHGIGQSACEIIFDPKSSDPNQSTENKFGLNADHDKFDAAVAPNQDQFKEIVENAFIATSRDNLSTFSTDVDTASYAIVRRFLMQNTMPPKDAAKVFDGPMVLFEDQRFDYGEQRMVGIGLVSALVVHVESDETIHVISMRKADSDETNLYYQNARL